MTDFNSGRLLATEQPVDRDVESSREFLDGRGGEVMSSARLDESGVPNGQLRPLVKGASGEAKALPRRPDSSCDLHGYSCSRDCKCSQGVLARTLVVTALNGRHNQWVASRITKRIEKLAKDRGLSGRELARKAGLGEPTVNTAFRRGSSFSVENALQIATALDMTLDQLAGAASVSAEENFQDVVSWATSTPSIARLLRGDDLAIVTANHRNVMGGFEGLNRSRALRLADEQERDPRVIVVRLRGGIDEGRVQLYARSTT